MTARRHDLPPMPPGTGVVAAPTGRPVDPEAILARAAGHEAAGRWNEAEAAYGLVTAVRPEDHRAWHGLGIAALGRGDLARALDAIDRAARLAPDVPLYQRNLCELNRRAGRLDAAVTAGRRAVDAAPNDAEAHYNLALARLDAGDRDGAVAGFERAVALDPRHGRAWNNLASALIGRGDLDAAEAACRRAVALDCRNAEALHNLGAVALARGDADLARPFFAAALALRPDLAASHTALAALDRPQDPRTAERRGYDLWSTGRFAEALAVFDDGLARWPDDVGLRVNRATTLVDLGRTAEADAEIGRVLAVEPANPTARMILALCRLASGDWATGWEAYEARFAGSDAAHRGIAFSVPVDLPQWSGEPGAADESILVLTEQGYGDCFQFCRYLPLLRPRFARVGFGCSPPTERLIRWSFGDTVEITTQKPTDVAGWTWTSPLLSLPRAFGTRPDTVPAAVPYLRVPDDARAVWRRRLADLAPGRRRIGIVWAGRPEHRLDATRSLAFADLAPLLELPGIAWANLQKRAFDEAPPAVPDGVVWLDWTEELDDFADTAALICELDLVVAVDTAVAHLAGALGRPVRLLDRFAGEWRWMPPRTDSPWYPTLRIHRQLRPGDWTAPVAALRDELAALPAHA